MIFLFERIIFVPMKWFAKGILLLFCVMLMRAKADVMLQTLGEAEVRNALALGGKISFSTNGSVLLTNPIILQTNVTIDASGHSISFDGEGASRLFQVNAGVEARFINVQLINGRARGEDGAPLQAASRVAFGAAIRSLGGIVTLQDCVLSNNVSADVSPISAYGGGICAIGGSILVTNTHFLTNSALGGMDLYRINDGNGRGGALFLNGCAAVISAARFSQNVAQGYFAEGGASWSDAPLEISDATFLDNAAVAINSTAAGGAVFFENRLNANRVSFQRNWAFGAMPIPNPGFPGTMRDGGAGFGGAISGGEVGALTNCFFQENGARGGWSGLYSYQVSGPPWIDFPAQGGALTIAGRTDISFCTFATNSLTAYDHFNGDAIAMNGGSVVGSIFSGHSHGATSGLFNDTGFNLTDGAIEGFSNPTSLKATNPKFLIGLEALLLSTGSPAINSGPTNGFPAADRLGNLRPAGGGVDRGAFEFVPIRVRPLTLLAGNQVKVVVENLTSRPFILKESRDLSKWSAVVTNQDLSATSFEYTVGREAGNKFYVVVGQ
jgi:hypothetical protein